MADRDHVTRLVEIASTNGELLTAQHEAARRLLAYDGEIFPHDGCAITLSVLMQSAGIAIEDTFQAIELTRLLANHRNWVVVPVGQQKSGDVGTTCGDVPVHGKDHIYLVLKDNNADEMVIADNQDTHPHFRYASGKGGRTPTKYFLRAP